MKTSLSTADYLSRSAFEIEEALLTHRFLIEWDIPPSSCGESMMYSLEAGGKRLRPILVLSAAEAVNNDRERSKAIAMPVACAIEMIHTYSLIHDDLPAMDNDDFRRGKLTNHKVFGEAMAILAGDGLLTHAFYAVTQTVNAGVPPEVALAIVSDLGSLCWRVRYGWRTSCRYSWRTRCYVAGTSWNISICIRRVISSCSR